MVDEIHQLRARYQRIAPFYDSLDLAFEYGRYRCIRSLLCTGLSGRILDAGVGTGRNIPFYPTSASVVGADLSGAMLKRAQRRRARAAATVEFVMMDLTHASFANDAFDAAIESFLFCTLPENLQVAALRELARVVKRGGRIRLLEYAQPNRQLHRVVARLWAPWVRWAYGASLDQHIESRFPAAGMSLVTARWVVNDRIRLIEAAVKA